MKTFSLRTLCVVVAMLAIDVSLAVRNTMEYRYCNNYFIELQAQGMLSCETQEDHDWLCHFGMEKPKKVTVIDANTNGVKCTFTEIEAEKLSRLYGLEELALDPRYIFCDASFLMKLNKVTSLKRFFLTGYDLRALTNLKLNAFPNLETLSINYGLLPDNYFSDNVELKRLCSIDMVGVDLIPNQIIMITKTPNLLSVDIRQSRCQVNTRVIEAMIANKSLKYVNVFLYNELDQEVENKIKQIDPESILNINMYAVPEFEALDKTQKSYRAKLVRIE